MKMNLESLPLKKANQPIVYGSFLFILLAMMTFALPSVSAQTPRQLSLGDIFTGLRSKKVTIEERNKLLTEAVKTRGITFAVTPEIEKELEETGAAKDLIEAIKQKALALKPTVVATPEPTPASTPVATPAPTPAQPDFAAFQKKGDSNFVRGEYDAAVINYTKAIELNPKESSIYLSRGLVYYNRKFYDLAVKDYGKAIEIDPKETTAYFYRGDSYEKLGELQKAADDFKKVLDLDSTNDDAKLNLQRVEGQLAQSKPKANIVPASVKTEPSPTPAPANTEETATKSTAPPQMVEIGSLVGFAVKLVQPTYPQGARSMAIGGDVQVNITIDEEGNPIAVKAVSGAPLLRNSCEEAIKRSKFKPVLVDNTPVKAKGFVVFKFKPY